MDPGTGRLGRSALRLRHPWAPDVDAGGESSVPRLHVIVPDRVAAAPGFGATAGALLERGGADLALHLRLRETSARRLYELAARLAARADEAGGWCMVNGRVDVALAAGTQGVQLGSAALPPRPARAVLGPGPAVGVSTHSSPEVRRAREAGANLVLLGTIFPTASHPGRPGAGPGRVAACRDLGLPVIAIGGIGPERAGLVRRAGAHGVAALSGVWDAPRPGAAVERYLEALRPSSAGGP